MHHPHTLQSRTLFNIAFFLILRFVSYLLSHCCCSSWWTAFAFSLNTNILIQMYPVWSQIVDWCISEEAQENTQWVVTLEMCAQSLPSVALAFLMQLWAHPSSWHCCCCHLHVFTLCVLCPFYFPFCICFYTVCVVIVKFATVSLQLSLTQLHCAEQKCSCISNTFAIWRVLDAGY